MHDHNHDHDHCHDHSHNHEHSHSHSHDEIADKKAIPDALILKYMLDHNIQHVKDAVEFAEKLKKNGHDEAATLILEAVKYYIDGNEKMSSALDSLNR